MKEKTAIVSPKFETVKEVAEWINILHWAHAPVDEGVIYGIKKETKKDGRFLFYVIEIFRD